MAKPQGGFLVRFDEERRTFLLQYIDGIEDGFSDALSSADWSVRKWEVCGLLFEPEVITHWALARKSKKVATGKVRVEFTEVTQTKIALTEVEKRVGSQLRRNIVSARSGAGGRVPPATWEGMKQAVGQIDPESLVALERLERLRDQSGEFVARPGAEIVAQQRDAVGVALDVFDQTGRLRKRTLRGWAAPTGQELTSFISGLGGVRTIEDQLVARDAAIFPGAGTTRHTVIGAVFSVGVRKLEVFNVNRTALETSLGVDLLYWNEAFDAWTLVQYKSMEKEDGAGDRSMVYRPDASFNAEVGRMQSFRAGVPDSWTTADGPGAYRLCGDGFFFKLCSRVQLEVLSEGLLPGRYLPRQFAEALLNDPGLVGPRGGKLITFENSQRHISNTLFAELVRDGWIGTRGVSSNQVATLVHDGLSARRAVVVARSRPAEATADPAQTLSLLGI